MGGRGGRGLKVPVHTEFLAFAEHEKVLSTLSGSSK